MKMVCKGNELLRRNCHCVCVCVHICQRILVGIGELHVGREMETLPLGGALLIKWGKYRIRLFLTCYHTTIVCSMVLKHCVGLEIN